MVQSSQSHADDGHDRLTQTIEVDDEAKEVQHGLDSASQASGDTEIADEEEDEYDSMQGPFIYVGAC
jgi:hypothetical protein